MDIDWTKYQNGATIVVEGERAETVFMGGLGHYILSCQQIIEYFYGDPCHIIWKE